MLRLAVVKVRFEKARLNAAQIGPCREIPVPCSVQLSFELLKD